MGALLNLILQIFVIIAIFKIGIGIIDIGSFTAKDWSRERRYRSHKKWQDRYEEERNERFNRRD